VATAMATGKFGWLLPNSTFALQFASHLFSFDLFLRSLPTQPQPQLQLNGS
jgi:hypothetical protein